MIETVAGIFTSSAFGAVTGMVGSWLTKREERETLKVQQTHEAKMRELDIKEAEKEHAQALQLVDKAIDQAEAEGRIASDVAAARAFAASQKAGNQSSGVKVVDAAKTLMRPLITVYLLVIASYLVIEINTITGGLTQLPASALLSLYEQVLDEMIFLTTTAVTWWFGARPSSKRN